MGPSADAGAVGAAWSLDDLVAELADLEQRSALAAMAAARFELSGEWGLDGATSMKAWLRHHGRMSAAEASALLHKGRFLTQFRDVAHAAVEGTLSAGQVAVVRAAVTSTTAPILDEQQARLVDIVAPLSVADTGTVMQSWRRHAEAILEAEPPGQTDRSLSWSTDPAGARVGRFVFDPVLAVEFEHAIGTAGHFRGAGDTRSSAQRNADALFDIVSFFNANHHHRGTPRHRPHVELHINAGEPWARTTDGTVLDVDTTGMLLCDAVLHRVLRAGSAVLDYGNAVYSFPQNLYRAIVARDGGCRFPGCERPVSWCDAHHIKEWDPINGETSIGNGALFCAAHHHLIHRQHLAVDLDPSTGVITIVMVDGRVLTSEPRGQPPPLPITQRPAPPRRPRRLHGWTIREIELPETPAA